jgi:predicted RNase H-like HicB family nuclease
MAEREQITLTIELEPVEGGWYQARLEEYPEVLTAAPTRVEARAAVLDALAQYLMACIEQGRRPVVRDGANLGIVAS